MMGACCAIVVTSIGRVTRTPHRAYAIRAERVGRLPGPAPACRNDLCRGVPNASAGHEWGFPLAPCHLRQFSTARPRLPIDRPVLVCYYALKTWVSLAPMLLPAGPEQPLFDIIDG